MENNETNMTAPEKKTTQIGNGVQMVTVKKDQQPGPTQTGGNFIGELLKTSGYKLLFCFYPNMTYEEIEMPFTPEHGSRIKRADSIYKVNKVTHDIDLQETRVQCVRTF